MAARICRCLSVLIPLLMGLAMAGQSAYAQESDAQRFIRLANWMNADPWSVSEEDRAWMWALVGDSNDIGGVILPSLLGELFGLKMSGDLTTTKAEMVGEMAPLLKARQELATAYIFGMAAYQLENPDRRSHLLEAQVAGLRSLLAAYPWVLANHPHAAMERVDQLLAEDVRDQLDAELERLAMRYVVLLRDDVPEKLWGEWAPDLASCGVADSERSIKVWDRGVRFADRGLAWNYTGGSGMLIARDEKVENTQRYNTFEYLQLSQDQTYLTLESDRDVPGTYYRCAREEIAKPTSIAEARKLVTQSLAREGAMEWMRSEEHLSWFEGITTSAFRKCGRKAKANKEKPFSMYFRLAETGRVKDSMLDGDTRFAKCFYSRMTKSASNFPAPVSDDFWMVIEIEPPDEEYTRRQPQLTEADKRSN